MSNFVLVPNLIHMESKEKTPLKPNLLHKFVNNKPNNQKPYLHLLLPYPFSIPSISYSQHFPRKKKTTPDVIWLFELTLFKLTLMAAIISCKFCSSLVTSKSSIPTSHCRSSKLWNGAWSKRFGSKCSSYNRIKCELQNVKVRLGTSIAMFNLMASIFVHTNAEDFGNLNEYNMESLH